MEDLFEHDAYFRVHPAVIVAGLAAVAATGLLIWRRFFRSDSD
ncbi:MAG: hypothetical protein QM775_34745 [Pirellulales bacterium]